MQYETSRKIAEHLALLGYSITEVEERETGKDVFIAEHPIHMNVTVRNNQYDIIFLTIFFGKFDTLKELTLELLQRVGKANYESTFTKWEAVRQSDGEICLVVSTFAVGYHQKEFGVLIEAMNKEITSNLATVINPENVPE